MSWEKKVKGKKFTHAKNIKSKIVLYYQHGTNRKTVEIPQSQYPWYFCIKTKAYNLNKNHIESLTYDGTIKKVEDTGRFTKIYVENLNIPPWKEQQGEEDDKLAVLRVLDTLGVQTFEADLSSVDRFLIDNEIEIEDEYNVAYFDIETDDRGGAIVVGRDRILSCAIIDGFGNTWYGTSKDEEKLIRAIVAQLRKHTIIIGYYSKEFDLPYIKARAELYDIECNFSDMIHIDLHAQILRIYMADKDGPPGYSLDVVSKFFGVGEKIKLNEDYHTGDFYKQWIENPALFKQYNIHDVDLLLKLDSKKQFIQTMILQCKLCGIFLDRFWNTNLTDKYLLREAKKQDEYLKTAVKHIKKDMPGGRVQPALPMIYTKVGIYDFAQMYSSIMRSFNIGPDTFVTFTADQIPTLDKSQLTTSPVTYVIKKLFNHIKDHFKGRYTNVQSWYQFKINGLTKEDVDEMEKKVLAKLNETITIKKLAILKPFLKIKKYGDPESGKFTLEYTYNKWVFFTKRKRSAIASMLDTYVAARDHAKRMKKKYEEDTDEWKLWEAYNQAYKLMGNIVFGYMAAEHTRAYDHSIACSITLGGQIIINMLKNFIESDFNSKVIYGDTDSIFINMPCEHTKFDAEFQPAFDTWITLALKKYFNIDIHCMVVEFEKFYDRFLLVKKKNYVGYIEDEEKYDTKGLEYIKRSTIPLTARLQKELAYRFLVDPTFQDQKTVTDWIKVQREKFFGTTYTEENIADITISTRVSKHPNELKSKQAHHHLIERIWADNEQFVLGDNIKYVIIKSDVKGVVVESIDRFFRRNDTIDKEQYWSTQIYSKLSRLLEVVFRTFNWDTLDYIKNYAITNRFARYEKAIKDPKRRSKAIVTIANQKSMHSEDKRSIFRWAVEHEYVGKDDIPTDYRDT